MPGLALREEFRGKRLAINVRGMEYLQTNPGEDENTAWRRLRPAQGSLFDDDGEYE